MKRKLISLMMTAAMLLSLFAPLRASAAETAGAGITLTVNGSKITATYSGPEAGLTLVSAGYDRSGQMQSIETKNGKTADFTRKNGLTYRIFALAPGTSAPLCKAGIEAETPGTLFSGKVEVPCVDRTVAEATSTAVRQALYARIALEAVLALDPTKVYNDKIELERQQKILDDAMDAYDGLMDAGAVLWAVAESAAEKAQKEASLHDAALMDASQEDALHWAQKLTEQYDSIKSNKKLGALGEMLGCDARTAYQQLTVAQEILRGNYETQAKTADNWVKGLTVVKTGAKVSMLVCGTIATGGAAGMLTAGEAVGVAVGTVDAGIEIAKTGATVIWGDDGKITKKFEEATKPITTVTSIYSLLTFDPNSAAPGEVLMFFNDMGEGMRDNYGAIVDELKDVTVDDVNNIVSVTVTSDRVSEEEMKEKIDKPLEKSGEPTVEDLDKIKEQMDENREPLTDAALDAALEELLKEEGLLEENQTLEDFDRSEIKRDYEMEVIQDMNDGDFDDDDDNNDNKPTYPLFHDDGPGKTHREVYWENELGKRVGLYEHYYNDVLEAQMFYDSEGKLVWTANYVASGAPEYLGQITQRSTYTNGYEIGSVCSTTHYFFTDPTNYMMPPEEAIGLVSYTEHWIYQSYYNEETGMESKGNFRYYSIPHCTYDYEGNLVERDTGEGVHWQKREEFDSKGNLSIEIVTNGDGTHTRTDFYTEKPVGAHFDPTGHEMGRYEIEDGPHPFDFLNERPDDGERLKWEMWRMESDENTATEVYDGEDIIGVTADYGFWHYRIEPAPEARLDFEFVRTVTVYFD